MNDQLMQQVQQMIQQGASKGDVAQQLMAAVQEGQLDQESVMQVFQQLGITEQDLQQAQQPQEPSEAQQQVMALGGMRRYPDGGQPSPEEMAMMQQQQAQQQGAPQEGQPQGGGDQMQQIMQQVQQMIEQGAQPIDVVQALMQNQIPPEAIMQILTEMGMPPQEAQGLIQEVMQGGQQQPQGPGEEQMEGAASNPQEEAQETPMQNYGGYVKEVMRKALGGKVTSDVDPGNVAAKRNLEFASVLKRNTHMSMLDNAFGNGVEDKQNNIPRADWGDEMKALMEKYKDDPNAKAYMDATQYLRQDDEFNTNLKTLRDQYKDDPNMMKTLDEYEKHYKNARQMQDLQQRFSSAYGPGQYYQRDGQYYNNPGAFSRLINNSGWDRSRPNFDISGIPLSNDPNAKYYITNKTDKQGMFGRRKVSFDVDWNRGDAAGTDPNKTVVDPNKAVTLTPGQQRRANRRIGNSFEDALETATDPIYDNKNLSEADRLNENYSTAFDVIAGNKDYTNQVNPYLGTYLDPAKTLGEDESDISRRDIKNYYEEAFPNLPRKDRRRLARESYRTGEIITGGKNRPDAVAAKYTFRTPEEEATNVKSNTDVNSNVPLNNNGDPLIDNKGALISYDYTTEEPSRRELRQQKREAKRSLEFEEDLKKQEEEKKQQVSEKYRENFDDALDESFSTINDNLTESQKLKAKSEKFNNLKSKVGNYKDYENIYQGTYLDPSGLDKDSSRGDIKDYYRDAFPELSRRDTRRLAREADKSGKILEGGPDGDLFTFKKITPETDTKPEHDFNLKQAFGNFANKVGGWFSRGDDSNPTEKAYGGNMWMPKADGGLQMYLKSLGLDEKDSKRLNRKASDADSGSGTFAVKDRFKLDWDAATDVTKQGMDWLSSKFDNLDVQKRMEDSDRFSSVNQFAPQSYEQMDRGLYGPQGEFIPNEQGPTTIFNPTDAEGTFYRQLYALGGNVTLDSFTDEELQILKDAGYNIDDLI